MSDDAVMALTFMVSAWTVILMGSAVLGLMTKRTAFAVNVAVCVAVGVLNTVSGSQFAAGYMCLAAGIWSLALNRTFRTRRTR